MADIQTMSIERQSSQERQSKKDLPANQKDAIELELEKCFITSDGIKLRPLGGGMNLLMIALYGLLPICIGLSLVNSFTPFLCGFGVLVVIGLLIAGDKGVDLTDTGIVWRGKVAVKQYSYAQIERAYISYRVCYAGYSGMRLVDRIMVKPVDGDEFPIMLDPMCPGNAKPLILKYLSDHGVEIGQAVCPDNLLSRAEKLIKARSRSYAGYEEWFKPPGAGDVVRLDKN